MERRSIRAGTHVKRLEEQIVAPLFRHTKVVKIFDRFLGRHELDLLEGASAGKRVRNHYRPAIEWLVDQFASQSQQRPGRLFEVTTGMIINSPIQRALARAAVRELKDFAEELTRRHAPDGPTVTINVKEERPGHENQLHHDRFLITDQMTFVFTAGFDLFLPDGTVKEMNILGPEMTRAEIEQRFYSFQDLN